MLGEGRPPGRTSGWSRLLSPVGAVVCKRKVMKWLYVVNLGPVPGSGLGPAPGWWGRERVGEGGQGLYGDLLY